MAETIDRSNFFKFTQGDFEPAATPLREPDYKSDGSSYWFTDQGVYRRSDYWGPGIGSCTWTVGGHETFGPAQLTGYIPWDGFGMPDATIKVSHPFGALDYGSLGARPLDKASYPDILHPDIDTFKVKREWFVEGANKVTFAGKTIDYRPGGMKIRAAAEAYANPHNRRVADDWERYEAAHEHDHYAQSLHDWKFMGSRARVDEIARAMESLGVDVKEHRGEASVEYLAIAVRRKIEDGTLPYGERAAFIKGIASRLGSGDPALDALRVLRAHEDGWLRSLEGEAHALPSNWDGEPATLAAAMLRVEDLSEGFDGSIGGVDALDDIDFSVLGERFAEAGLGSIDERGVLAPQIHRYEQAEDMLAALGMSLDQIGSEHDGSPDPVGEDGNGIPERYLSPSPIESMREIEGCISAKGLRAALLDSDPVAVNLAAEALSFVERADMHGVEMYWNEYAEPGWGAEELACIAASMAALGGEEFGFTPADSRREAAEVLGKRFGDLAGRDDLAASLDLESFGQRAAAHTIVAGGNWYADPTTRGRLKQIIEQWTPGADTPREQSVLWSDIETGADRGRYGEFDLSTADGFKGFVQAVDSDLADDGALLPFPAGWGFQIRVDNKDWDDRWATIEDIVQTAGGTWAADAWASVKLGEHGLAVEEAAAAVRAGDISAIENASRVHGAYGNDGCLSFTADSYSKADSYSAMNRNTGIFLLEPEALRPEELSQLAQTRPDLFCDALCEKHPCLADARDQVGDMWAVGDGTVTYMTAPQLESYFATEPTLADMREAGSTWRDWVYELEGCGLAESVYGEPMREQFAAEAAAADMDAPVIEVMETEAPSRPNNDGFDH